MEWPVFFIYFRFIILACTKLTSLTYPKRLFFIFFVIFGNTLLSNAQVSRLQTLLSQLDTAHREYDREHIYYALSHYYWNKDADSALLMGERSLESALKINDDTAAALAYLAQGVAYEGRGQYAQALECHLKALRFSEKAGMEGLTGNNYTNIGIVYEDMKEHAHALDYFRWALDIALRDQRDTAHTGVAICYMNIADNYLKQNQFDSSIYYNEKALPIARRLKDSSYLAKVLSGIGQNFAKKEQGDSALIYARKAKELSVTVHDQQGIASADNLLAEGYRLQKKRELSILFAGEALRIADSTHTDEAAINAYHVLYQTYKDLGDHKTALDYRNKEIDLRDTDFIVAENKQISGLEADYEIEKKQHQIDLLKEESSIRENKLARNRGILIVLIPAALLLGIACLLLYRGINQKQRLNTLLQASNGEVISQNSKLESLNAVKNKLLSIISHDLRSPIGTLIGFVDLLKRGGLPLEKIGFFAGKMSESLTATSHLLDNLLFWAKGQMEGMSVEPANFDCRELIAENLTLAQNRAANKNITLRHSEDHLPLPVFADRNMIDLVLRNLIENAIKFSHEGDTVSILGSAAGDQMKITVTDTGQGIPRQHQSRILDGTLSFTTNGTSLEKGSGLGLTLCKDLVEKNGGAIWFESEEGSGTSFHFTLPGRR